MLCIIFFKYGNGSVCKWMLWKITLIYDYTQLNKIQNNVHIRIVTQILKSLGKAYTWGDHGMKTLGHREPQKWFKLPLQHASPLSHLKYTISILWGRGDQTTFITPCQETALQTLCSQLHVSCLCGWHASGLLVSKEVIGPSEASQDFLALWGVWGSWGGHFLSFPWSTQG